MSGEVLEALRDFIRLLEAHKGERLSLSTAQVKTLLVLLNICEDLVRRLNGEWKRGA